MTVLERRGRRNDRRSLCAHNGNGNNSNNNKRRTTKAAAVPSSSLRFKNNIITKKMNRYFRLREEQRLKRLNRPTNKVVALAKSKPRFDAATTIRLRSEVMRLIQQQQQKENNTHNTGCTLYDMAAILSFPDIVDSYNEASIFDYDDDNDRTTNNSNPFGRLSRSIDRMFLSKTKRNEIKQTRRYQLHNAMQILQQTLGASSHIIISSWLDAVQHLSAVIEFPPDDDDDNGIVTASSSQQQQQQQDVVANVVDNDNNSSSEDTIEQYRQRLHKLRIEQTQSQLLPSQRRLQQVSKTKLSNEIGIDKADEISMGRLDEAMSERESSKKSDAVKQAEEAIKQRERDEEAAKRASELMRPLTDEEKDIVQKALYQIGPDNEIVAQDGPDTIQRISIRKLHPGTWLNDEVIHFFYVMLAKRDAELSAKDSNRRRSHFFKSFFMTKLLNEGHKDPAKDGTYEYKNVKRWSKKVPGKNIFELDKIFFPINVGGTHWICAVIHMQEKRIQIYDSFGSPGEEYLQHLFQYVKDEHQDKMKCPLPNPEEWTLVVCDARNTPRQNNCDDCGVFTCMFADFIAMGYPLSFNQNHITQCRERIALSIMKGKAIV